MNINYLTNSNWLISATKKLKTANIKSARLDALLILEETLGISRIRLVSDNNINISPGQFENLNIMLERRLNNEPLAYIRGHSEFFGRDFSIVNDVLIPRPESEAFIEIVKSLNIENIKILDLGCGSGCLGITTKLEIPNANIVLSDVSSKALETARENAKKFKAEVTFKKANLLEKSTDNYDVMLVNLPYVPDSMKESNNLSYEPPLALFGGLDGMDVYRSFWQQVGNLIHEPQYILCESLKLQHSDMNRLAKNNGYRLGRTSGLVQLFEMP